MQTTNEAKNDSVKQLAAFGLGREADHAENQRLMQMAPITSRKMLDTRAERGLDVVHLSETGLHAGRRLCLAPKDPSSRSVHAMYAPLHNPTFLASVCRECLHIWALEAYDDGEDIPEYLLEPRAAAKLAAVQVKTKEPPSK